MDNHVYKIVELAGSSTDSIEAAIQNAIGKASRSLHHLRWFQVVETRGDIENDRVAHYQVTLKVGFTVDE
ncbi:MAG TPA: dodecin [Geminicoccaceae bacterium]|nr:dodecin [Geminicoccaceae bacterium]